MATMNPIEKAAYVAVQKAVENCPVGVGANARVKAGDVATLAKLVPTPHDEFIGPIARGAMNNKPDALVFQQADSLKYLLEKVPGTTGE